MSNFSHELRTPINGILGSAQFLQDTVSDDYQNELLQSIVVSSNTLLDTVNYLPFVAIYRRPRVYAACNLTTSVALAHVVDLTAKHSR